MNYSQECGAPGPNGVRCSKQLGRNGQPHDGRHKAFEEPEPEKPGDPTPPIIKYEWD